MFIHMVKEPQQLTVLSTRALIEEITEHLYDEVCRELDRTDPESNEYCLLLSNFADDCYAFISGIKRCREL